MQKRVELKRGNVTLRVVPEHVEARKAAGWSEKTKPRARRAKAKEQEEPQESTEVDE